MLNPDAYYCMNKRLMRREISPSGLTNILIQVARVDSPKMLIFKLQTKDHSGHAPILPSAEEMRFVVNERPGIEIPRATDPKFVVIPALKGPCQQ